MPVLAVSRKQVAAAVYALVDAAVGQVVRLQTSSRRYRSPLEVDPSEMPALFLVQTPERFEHTEGGMLDLPPRRVMCFEAWLYTSDPQESSIVPIDDLNDMVDAIELAFAPNALTGKLNLGGLVTSCRIDGAVDWCDGLLVSGKSAASVPISVVRP